MVYFQSHSGVSAKCRDTRVEELWGLTSFFGYSTQTFVQAVNLLDRFLTIMKVQIQFSIQAQDVASTYYTLFVFLTLDAQLFMSNITFFSPVDESMTTMTLFDLESWDVDSLITLLLL